MFQETWKPSSAANWCHRTRDWRQSNRWRLKVDFLEFGEVYQLHRASRLSLRAPERAGLGWAKVGFQSLKFQLARTLLQNEPFQVASVQVWLMSFEINFVLIDSSRRFRSLSKVMRYWFRNRVSKTSTQLDGRCPWFCLWLGNSYNSMFDDYSYLFLETIRIRI